MAMGVAGGDCDSAFSTLASKFIFNPKMVPLVPMVVGIAVLSL